MKKLLSLFLLFALFSCSHSPAYAEYSSKYGLSCETNPCIIEGNGGIYGAWKLVYEIYRDGEYKFKTRSNGWCASACSIIAGYAINDGKLSPNARTKFCFCHPKNFIDNQLWMEIKSYVRPDWYKALRSGKVFRVINGVIRYE